MTQQQENKRSHSRYLINNNTYCSITECLGKNNKKIITQIIDLSQNGMAILTDQKLLHGIYELELFDLPPIIGSVAYSCELETGGIRYGFLFDRWIDKFLIEQFKR